VPETLEKLTGEERRQVYGMLRLRVRLNADERMEACGILRIVCAGCARRAGYRE
jgi:hypothetical protein